MTTPFNEFVDKVGCIKGLRTLTGMGLKDAKDFVETVQTQSPYEIAIAVSDIDEYEIKDAIRRMEAGGIYTAPVGTSQDLQESIKQSALLAVESNEFAIAIRLLEIIDR
jgi:hypothetical protein